MSAEKTALFFPCELELGFREPQREVLLQDAREEDPLYYGHAVKQNRSFRRRRRRLLLRSRQSSYRSSSCNSVLACD